VCACACVCRRKRSEAQDPFASADVLGDERNSEDERAHEALNVECGIHEEGVNDPDAQSHRYRCVCVCA
jgi:hypothetical protein